MNGQLIYLRDTADEDLKIAASVGSMLMVISLSLMTFSFLASICWFAHA